MAFDIDTYWTIIALAVFIALWGLDKVLEFLEWKFEKNKKAYKWAKLGIGLVYAAIGLYILVKVISIG